MQPLASTLSTSAAQLEVLEESGSGRTFVVMAENRDRAAGAAIYDAMVKQGGTVRVVLLHAKAITEGRVSQYVQSLIGILQQRSIRSVSLIGIGAAASVVQGLALVELKLVRTVCLIDATTRPHPTTYERMLARVEQYLPLGLPFRSPIEGFDSRPYLQRIRCPVMVLTTPHASAYILSEATVLGTRLPTAWTYHLTPADDLSSLILSFQDVPAKCPQKNRARESA